MPQRRRRARATPRSDEPTNPPPTGRTGATPTTTAPIERGMDLWSRYARETGETVTEFLRRFGEEQQKSYEAWAANVETLRPKVRPPEVDMVRARLDEWNRRAEDVGARVREAFDASLAPQRDLLDLWVRPLLPANATSDDRTREILSLVQKLWSELTIDLTQKVVAGMRPDKSLDDLIRGQQEVAQQFTETFQKLARVYFTSPGFVATFGKSLDNSLELQKGLKDSDELFRRVTGLPTRRGISELNQAVRDLSEQVSRLGGKRS
jgi:hypothetical protein